MLNIWPQSMGISDIDLGTVHLSQYWKHPWTSVVHSAYQPNSYALYITYILILKCQPLPLFNLLALLDVNILTDIIFQNK